MNQSGDRHMGVFAARVCHFQRRPVGFFHPRNDLAPNWAVWIFRINEIEKVGRNCQRELVSREDYPSALFGRKCNLLFKLLKVGDPVFKLPFPVVPELGNDVWPETWGEGKETLISGFG